MLKNLFKEKPLHKGYRFFNYKAFNLEEGMVIYHENWDMKSEGPTIFVPRHLLTEGDASIVLLHFASKSWMTIGLLYEIASIIHKQAQIEESSIDMSQLLEKLDHTAKDYQEILDRMKLYEM
jgi:hypothetical protein